MSREAHVQFCEGLGVRLPGATHHYVPIFDALLAAGAHIEDGWLAWLEKQEGRTAEQKSQIAEVLRRYGAKS